MVSIYNLVIYFIIALILKPLLDEIWTIKQIIKSFFVTPPDLKRKYGDWAVVTGCTDGIGKGYAFQLAKRGINIVLISRNPAKLSEVAKELTAKYQIETKIVVADFSEGEKIYPAIKEQLKDVEIGILVNNVGIATEYPMFFGEIPEKEIGDIIRVNVGALTHMTRIVMPGLIERKRGAIVNVSSASKLAALPLFSLYSASKIFNNHYTDGLRIDLSKHNITVQELCPFFISTKIIDFSSVLNQIGLFVPDPYTYASQAIETLGVIDNTTGYWPHRFQYAAYVLVPPWVQSYVTGYFNRAERNNKLKLVPGYWSLKIKDLMVRLLLFRIFTPNSASSSAAT